MDIKQIIRKLGGPAVIAEKLGITSQAVSQWQRIPVKRAVELESQPGCTLTRFEMRPDVFGSPREAA